MIRATLFVEKDKAALPALGSRTISARSRKTSSWSRVPASPRETLLLKHSPSHLAQADLLAASTSSKAASRLGFSSSRPFRRMEPIHSSTEENPGAVGSIDTTLGLGFFCLKPDRRLYVSAGPGEKCQSVAFVVGEASLSNSIDTRPCSSVK